LVQYQPEGLVERKRSDDMARIFTYYGKTVDELRKLSLEEFAKLIPSRERRKLLRGLSEKEKKFLQRLKKSDKPVRTHLRQMIIIPEMIDKRVLLHNGKEWVLVIIKPEMVGHRLGEFVLTRKKVLHSAPGVGATRASKFLPLK
jgi:small subunit ribosomal protein S19